ncbi:MAG TPA: response regulator, partial [Catenuloplanes sp.]
MTSAPIRVLLADDEHLIRGAMAALLGLEDDLSVVGQASTGTEALAMARAIRPDVAILDLQMPGMDGVTVAKALHAELPACRTMIVTSHGRP